MYYNPKHRNETAGTKPPKPPEQPKQNHRNNSYSYKKSPIVPRFFAAIILTYLPSQVVNVSSPRALFLPPVDAFEAKHESMAEQIEDLNERVSQKCIL